MRQHGYADVHYLHVAVAWDCDYTSGDPYFPWQLWLKY